MLTRTIDTTTNPTNPRLAKTQQTAAYRFNFSQSTASRLYLAKSASVIFMTTDNKDKYFHNSSLLYSHSYF